MTASDLIVLAPWVIFALCLAVVCLRLVRARRPAKRPGSAKRRRMSNRS